MKQFLIRQALVVCLASVFGALILGSKLNSLASVAGSKALTAPIDCTDSRVKNVRDCVYTESTGEPVCDKDHHLCSSIRTKCVYDREPINGGGWAFCQKEVNTTCSTEVVQKCVPTPTPSPKPTVTPRPTASPKPAATPKGATPTATPKAPAVVNGAKKPSVLPKTGVNTLGIIGGLFVLSGSGIWIYKRFKSV